MKPRMSLRAAGTRPLVRIVALCSGLAAGCASPQAPGPPAPLPTPVQVEAPTVELVLMGTTDVHNRLYPYDYYTGTATDHGLALLKPIVDSIRAANPGRTFLFDSGDLLQGSPLGFIYARQYAGQPNPIPRAMNLLGYDAAAIGNHEFNYGLEHLGHALDQANFPFVSANIFRAGTDQYAYTPYTLIPHITQFGDTLLIGVTGNTPPGVHLWDRANVEGVLEFRDVVASLRAVVADLRGRGVDLVIVLSHGGLEGTSYDTLATGLAPENVAARVAREVPGVDVIFLGHTHRELPDSIIPGPRGPVLLTQAGHWARSLAVAGIELRQRARNDWVVVERSARLLRAEPGRADRTFMDSLRWQHERAVVYVNSRVGRATQAMSAREARVRDTPIIDFVNEVQRRAGNADLSATAAFRVDAAIDTGAITIAQIARLYPYDNTLQVLRITGAQLKQYLEKAAEYYRGWPAVDGSVTAPDVPGYNFDIISGAEYTLDIAQPVGQRVVSLTVNGRPVTADQSFTLALNNYRASGGGGYSMIRDAPVVRDEQQDIRELLIEEVRRRGTLRAEDYFTESWRLVPEEAARAATLEQASAERRQSGGAAAVAERPRLRILSTNDFHGRLLPERPSWAGGQPVGGAALLASYFRAERHGFAGPTAIMDGGDILQGTPVSNLTRGRSTVDYYNMVGYSAAAIGNHEFDWTVAVLRERIDQAKFPWLSANLFVAGSDTAPSWVRQTALLDVDGVRVGVIGLTTEETPFATKPSNVRGLEFRSGAAAMDRWVPELRQRGATFVIVVAHAGALCEDEVSRCEAEGYKPSYREMIDWARAVSHKPDLIVAGHTHRVVRTWENGIPIVETGSYGTRYSVTDLERVSPDSVDVWIRGTPAAWPGVVEPDTAVDRLVQQYLQEIGPAVNRVITQLAEPLHRRQGESALGRLVADAQRAATGSHVAIMNNGGLRRDFEPGPLRWGELYELQPFANLLVKLELTGAQLRAAVEHIVRNAAPAANMSGVIADYEPTRPSGTRITALRLESGEPVRDEARYIVTVNDFMAEGGDGFAMFLEPQSREDTGIVDLDALIEYLGAQPQPLRPPAEPRLRPASSPARDDS